MLHKCLEYYDVLGLFCNSDENIGFLVYLQDNLSEGVLSRFHRLFAHYLWANPTVKHDIYKLLNSIAPIWRPGASIINDVLARIRRKSEIRHAAVWRISDLRRILSCIFLLIQAPVVQ